MDCEKSKHISKTKDNHYTEVSLKIRPAVEAMLEDAKKVANGIGKYATYEDVFGTET